MAQQIATSKPNSCFAVPANHVLPKLSAWTFPATRSAVPNVAISQSTQQGLSGAPSTNTDNNTTVPQVVHVTSDGTVYYSNTSSGPNFVGIPVPINVYSAAPVTVGGPEVLPTVFIATPPTEPTAFMVQYLAQVLASSKDQLREWKMEQYNRDPLQ